MKRVLLAIAFVIGAIQFSNAQISYGLKAGLNFASPSDAVTIDGSGDPQPNTSLDANTSWHAGGWLRVKVPVLGLYVRPEVIYTSISATLPESVNMIGGDYKLDRIDVPVLVGLKMFGVGNVFAGPVFEYVLTSDFNVSNETITSVKTDDFFVGAQIGVGLEFWKLGLDVRYETAFSSNTTTFGDPNFPQASIEMDNSPDQFIVGLSYKF
ncbi:outer membrane beta-barrel protein [Flavicella marina]|uniref:outer membrane beta-barrel protein n=1 Tax=Flavicella marina TaxID=1475951 RepID=UPI00126468B8|nr:outer membrane beta-barrel protein [Flavicella marina]